MKMPDLSQPIDYLGHQIDTREATIRYEIRTQIERRLSQGRPLEDIRGVGFDCTCCKHRIYFVWDADSNRIMIGTMLTPIGDTDWEATDPHPCQG